MRKRRRIRVAKPSGGARCNRIRRNNPLARIPQKTHLAVLQSYPHVKNSACQKIRKILRISTLQLSDYGEKKNFRRTTRSLSYSRGKTSEEWNTTGNVFFVIDIVEALTDTNNARRYWSDLKRKLADEEGFNQVYKKIVHLKLPAPDGKMRETDTADTETVFRIIQSIPSPKAEPFKKWPARVGYERLREIEDPELAQKRMKALYEAKGYPKAWIDKRLRGIAVRDALTDEWKARGDSLDFATAFLRIFAGLAMIPYGIGKILSVHFIYVINSTNGRKNISLRR